MCLLDGREKEDPPQSYGGCAVTQARAACACKKGGSAGCSLPAACCTLVSWRPILFGNALQLSLPPELRA